MDVTARLADLLGNVNNGIGGTITVYDLMPRDVLPANLPAATILPLSMGYEYNSEGIVKSQGQYQVTVYLGEAWQGTATQAQANLETIRGNIRDYFWARPGLELTGADTVVYSAHLISDSGYIQVAYGDTVFAAIQFVFDVVQYHKITYPS